MLESLTPFPVILLAVDALGISNGWTAAAALLFFGSRIIHAIRIAGVTVILSAAFYSGTVAISILASQLA